MHLCTYFSGIDRPNEHVFMFVKLLLLVCIVLYLVEIIRTRVCVCGGFSLLASCDTSGAKITTAGYNARTKLLLR